MARHAVLIYSQELTDIISGKQKYLTRSFKKKPEFLRGLSYADTIYFRQKRGEILGQFIIGKLIIVERWGSEDEKLFKDLKIFTNSQNTPVENSIVIIIQIEKLEQLITSPVEIDKRSQKEWIVLD